MNSDSSAIIDDLLGLQELPPDYKINRLEILLKDQFLFITEGKPTNGKALRRIVFYFLLGLTFTMVTVMAILVGLELIFVAVPGICALLGIGAGVFHVMKTYYFRKVLAFDGNALTIRKITGETIIAKSDVRSVYVRDLILNSSRSLQILLSKKSGYSQHQDRVILELDLPDSSWFSSQKNRDNFEKTKQEAYQIGKLISEYWQIPFRV